MSKGRGSFNGRVAMTPAAVARIHSAVARAHGGQAPGGGFLGRAQATIARNGGGGQAGGAAPVPIRPSR
jgi:hypothetical protein